MMNKITSKKKLILISYIITSTTGKAGHLISHCTKVHRLISSGAAQYSQPLSCFQLTFTVQFYITVSSVHYQRILSRFGQTGLLAFSQKGNAILSYIIYLMRSYTKKQLTGH